MPLTLTQEARQSLPQIEVNPTKLNFHKVEICPSKVEIHAKSSLKNEDAWGKLG